MALNFLKNTRKAVGNAVDLTGRLAKQPIGAINPALARLLTNDYGISERIAGGNTATTGLALDPLRAFQSVAPLGTQGPAVLGERTVADPATVDPNAVDPNTGKTPFDIAVGSAGGMLSGGGAAGGAGASDSMNIRILGGQMYDISQPDQAKAYYSAFNAGALDKFNKSAAGVEQTARENILRNNTESGRAFRNLTEQEKALAAAQGDYVASADKTLRNIGTNRDLAFTRTDAQYSGNPLLQSSQGVSKYIIGNQADEAVQEANTARERTLADYLTKGRNIADSRYDLTTQLEQANAAEQARLEAVNAQRAEVAAQARDSALGDVVLADATAGRPLDVTQYLSSLPTVQNQQVDLTKYGALTPGQVQAAPSAIAGVGPTVAVPTETPEQRQARLDKEKNSNILNFLEYGQTR
jgi:hypothetical protein